MRPVEDGDLADRYRRFGEVECDDSATFSRWSLGVAADPEVLALIAALPRGKQQPNLVFAAARWQRPEVGTAATSYDDLRRVLVEEWHAVRATVLRRATQTNEVARCATLLPVLAGLPQPLALLEVGASAGLTLFPDRCSYRYRAEGEGGGDHDVELDPPDGPGPVVLPCSVTGPAPLPHRLPEVVWRGGIDLHPLDVHDDDAMAWLSTLVWPEHDERRRRLAAAVAMARTDPPVLVRGDLLEELPALVDRVPGDATLVVFHSAVLAYLSEADRARFTTLVSTLVSTLGGHWISNEGPLVVPLPAPEGPVGSAVGTAPMLVRLDGRPVAWAHGHGQALHWLP